MHAAPVVTVLLAACCLHLNSGEVLSGDVVRKVLPQFPGDTWACDLGMVAMKVANRYTCMKPCLGMAECRLYCVLGGTCHYLSSWVMPHYNGVMGVPPINIYEECYTFRHHDKDYTGSIASITTTAVIHHHNVPQMAINGYFCHHSSACFLGDTSSTSWDLQIDLGATRAVSAIEFIVASYEMWSSRNTENVRVRLGDDPVYGNNPEFAFLPGETPRDVVLTLLPVSPPSMSGRYLQLTSEATGPFFFGICDIRVLG